MYKVPYCDHTYLIDSVVYIYHLEARLKNLAQIDIPKKNYLTIHILNVRNGKLFYLFVTNCIILITYITILALMITLSFFNLRHIHQNCIIFGKIIYLYLKLSPIG